MSAPIHETRETFWNGEASPARRVVVEVRQTSTPLGWSKGLEGTARNAVEVTYAGETFYLDDEDGGGWHKVTVGHGSPMYGHREVPVAEIIRVRSDDEPCGCGAEL